MCFIAVTVLVTRLINSPLMRGDLLTDLLATNLGYLKNG